jgi:hypothetical protein
MKGFSKGNGNLAHLTEAKEEILFVNMKTGFVLSMVLALFGGRVMAQQSTVSIGRTNAPALPFETAALPYLNPNVESKGAELKLGKGLRARGPLVHLFHTRKAGEVPKRFWQLINPFSRSEAAPETEVIRARDLSPRAWTTTVGWHSGVSDITYSLTQPEGGGGIGLVSIGR